MFIELHFSSDGKLVVINTDRIERMYRSNDGTETIIVNNHLTTHVKESLSDILEQMERMKEKER